MGEKQRSGVIGTESCLPFAEVEQDLMSEQEHRCAKV